MESENSTNVLVYIKEPLPVLIPIYWLQLVFSLLSFFVNLWIAVVSYGNRSITGNYKVSLISYHAYAATSKFLLSSALLRISL